MLSAHMKIHENDERSVRICSDTSRFHTFHLLHGLQLKLHP